MTALDGWMKWMVEMDGWMGWRWIRFPWTLNAVESYGWPCLWLNAMHREEWKTVCDFVVVFFFLRVFPRCRSIFFFRFFCLLLLFIRVESVQRSERKRWRHQWFFFSLFFFYYDYYFWLWVLNLHSIFIFVVKFVEQGIYAIIRIYTVQCSTAVYIQEVGACVCVCVRECGVCFLS